MRKDPTSLLGAEFSGSFADGGILRAEDGGGEEGGIDRAGLADGECAYRNAAGHLRDGEERIETLEGFRFDGNAEDGENGLRGGHGGEMGGAAGSGDEHFGAAVFSVGSIFKKPVGG